MRHIGRRNLLQMILGVGAAAACGIGTARTAEAATTAAEAASPTGDASPAANTAEAVESELQPNQFFIVRRRRVRRRVFFVRPRRRVFIVRRRPRRFVRVVRFRRFGRRRF